MPDECVAAEPALRKVFHVILMPFGPELVASEEPRWDYLELVNLYIQKTTNIAHRADVLRAVLKSERQAFSLERKQLKLVPWSSLLARDAGLPEVFPCKPNQVTDQRTKLPLCRPCDITRLLLRNVLNRTPKGWLPKAVGVQRS